MQAASLSNFAHKSGYGLFCKTMLVAMFDSKIVLIFHLNHWVHKKPGQLLENCPQIIDFFSWKTRHVTVDVRVDNFFRKNWKDCTNQFGHNNNG